MRRVAFLKTLGSGAVGTVYLASLEYQRGFSQQVAIKVLLAKDTVRDSHFIARMRDEARLLGLLRDDNILKVLELVRVAGRDGVVMEYVEGVDIARLIEAGETLPPRALTELGSAVAGTLHRAHRAVHPNDGTPLNVIHRDVKPANVMVTVRGAVKLLDFGIAKAKFETREAHTGQIMLGTLNYMAPEYILTGEISTAADIYALGITLYEAASNQAFGQPKIRRDAFAAKVAQALQRIQDTHGEIVPVLAHMLAWDPNDRPDGATVESLLLAKSDVMRGSSLRTWASTAVARVVAARTAEVEDQVGLGGQTFELSDEDPILELEKGPIDPGRVVTPAPVGMPISRPVPPAIQQVLAPPSPGPVPRSAAIQDAPVAPAQPPAAPTFPTARPALAPPSPSTARQKPTQATPSPSSMMVVIKGLALGAVIGLVFVAILAVLLFAR